MNLVFPDFGLQSSAFGLLLLVLRILFDRITGEFLDFAVYEDCNFSFFFYPVRGTNFTFVRKLTGRCCQSLKIMIDLLMVLVEVSLDHLQSVQLLFFNLVIVHSLFKALSWNLIDDKIFTNTICKIDVIWIQLGNYLCAYGAKSFNQFSKLKQFKITNCENEDQVTSQSSVHTSLGRTVSFST